MLGHFFFSFPLPSPQRLLFPKLTLRFLLLLSLHLCLVALQPTVAHQLAVADLLGLGLFRVSELPVGCSRLALLFELPFLRAGLSTRRELVQSLFSRLAFELALVPGLFVSLLLVVSPLF